MIKTIHIPGFRALNEKKITINLTNKECNSPDYCILGGDYLLNNDDDRISVIFDNLSSLKDVSKLIYTKSRSDKDFLFIKLIEKGNISNGKGKNNNELGITSSIIRDLKIPITILNICFHKIDTTILPEISESAYDAIIKMVEEHADNNSYFKKDIKVIYCHYDIFTKDDQYMQFNNKLEQYLREKNFFLLIHDHTHNITDFKPGNFIHIDRTHEDNKLGIPRIAGGYFDVPPYGSDLYPFYLSFHFIYDEEKKKKFVKYFEFKIWKSKTQSQRDNFVFDGNVTAKFMKKFNKLTNENRKNTESHQGSNQEQKTMLSEKQKYPNQDRNTAMERTTVFVCYSHKNDAYLKRVQVHLKVLKHEGIEADVWDDTRIKAGTEWQKEIEAALASAKVSIMLVSADFLASDFIMNNELPSLLESAQSSGTTILSLIVEPCRFSKSKLSRFQAVNDPDTPLSKLLKPEQEEQYLALIDRITELL